MNSSRYWKVFLPFLFFLILFKFGGGLHYTLMAPFGEKVFPLWLVGTTIGIIGLIQMMLDLPAGYLLDRFGYKKLLILTTCLFLGASLVFLCGATRLSFVLTLLLGGFGWLFFGPGTHAYAMIEAPQKMAGRFVAARDVFASLGIVLSSLVMIFAVGWKVEVTGFILCAIFLAALIAITVSPEEKFHQPPPRSRRHYFDRQFLREVWAALVALKPVSFILISTSLVSAAFYAIIWFVVPILLARSEEANILGLGLGIFDLAVVLLGFALGRLVDAYNKKVLVILGLLVFAIAGTLLGFHFGALFILLGFIAAAGDELTGLSLWAWLYQIDKDKKHYGILSGAVSFFEDIGWALGPILAGVLYTLVGPSYTIALGGFMIFLNLLFFYIAVHPFAPASIKQPLPLKQLRRYKHKH